MPASILWFSPTTDVIFQVLPTHFACFFLGCWFLVRFHRSIEIWPHLSLIRRFYFHHGFGMFWLGIFRGMRSSTVNLECRHWFCDIDEGCHFWVSYLNFWQFTNIFGPIAIYSNVFSKAFTFIEGSLEVKLPTIWTDEKQSRAETERRERLEERRSEEKESEERRCRCAKR